MELQFDYGGRLAEILRICAPQTHTQLSVYKASAKIYDLFECGDKYRKRREALAALPTISDDELRDPKNILASIEGVSSGNSWEYTCIKRTLASHSRRVTSIEDAIWEDLTIALSRCVPLFLLEVAKPTPRTWLFNLKKGKVFHYLTLPPKKAYSMQLC